MLEAKEEIMSTNPLNETDKQKESECHGMWMVEVALSALQMQKCAVGRKVFDVLNTVLGAYAFINVSPTTAVICQLFLRPDMCDDYCEYDRTVCTYQNMECKSSELPAEKLFEQGMTCLRLDESNFVVAENKNPLVLNRVNIVIVMDSITNVRNWKRTSSKSRSNFLLSLLRMFVVTSKCLINTDHLVMCGVFGIKAVIILNAQFSDIDSCRRLARCVGRVSDSTVINVQRVITQEKLRQLQDDVVPHLGGLDKELNLLKDMLALSLTYPHSKQKSALLVGPPGCGKTSLVRAIARDVDAELCTVLGPEVCRSVPGESELELLRIFYRIRDISSSDDPSILLLDEVDALCPKRGSSSQGHGERITSQLLTLLDEACTWKGVFIVATTNRASALDPALRRMGRLDLEISINVPQEEDRMDILVSVLRPLTDPLSDEDLVRVCCEASRWTPGYVGADLALVSRQAVQSIWRKQWKDRQNGESHKSSNILNVTSETLLFELRAAVSNHQASGIRGALGTVAKPRGSWDDIGGLEDVQKQLRMAVEWPLMHPEAFERMGLKLSKGILLYGPPGCAKTTLVRTLAATTHSNFLSVSAAELYSPFVGDSEKAVASLFHQARQVAPAILFIDEIDALAGSRSAGRHSASPVQERILSTFLMEMDGIGVHIEAPSIPRKAAEGETSTDSSVTVHKQKVSNVGVSVIGATNRPDLVDDALLRPGRFDKILYIPPPDHRSRVSILKLTTKNTPLASDVDLTLLADKTEMFSGADLKSLCREAALHALTVEGMAVQEVNLDHFLFALSKMRPSISKEKLKWYEDYNGENGVR